MSYPIVTDPRPADGCFCHPGHWKEGPLSKLVHQVESSSISSDTSEILLKESSHLFAESEAAKEAGRNGPEVAGRRTDSLLGQRPGVVGPVEGPRTGASKDIIAYKGLKGIIALVQNNKERSNLIWIRTNMGQNCTNRKSNKKSYSVAFSIIDERKYQRIFSVIYK